MTTRTRYFVICSLLVMTVGVGTGLVAYYVGFPLGAFAGRGGPDELRFIPRDAAVVAYADVREVMRSPLRERVRSSVSGQEDGQRQLMDLTGINIETDIEHVVAAFGPSDPQNPMSHGGLVLIRGIFNEEKIQALMREHGGHAEQYQGKWVMVMPARRESADPATDPNATPTPDGNALRSVPDFSLSFLQPGLVAFGSPDRLRRAIDLGNGGDNVTTNEELMSIIQSLDSGNAWVAGRFDALRSAVPAGFKDQLPAISWFSASGTVTDGLNGVIRAEAATDEAAKNLRDVVQGFIALAKLQAGSQPAMQAAIQSLDLQGTGKTVALSFSLPAAVFDLIESQVHPRQKAAH